MFARLKTKLICGMLMLVAAVVAPFPAGAQCPMCKNNVAAARRNDEQKSVGEGLNAGIMLLLSFPYILAGAAGLIWYHQNRKRKLVNAQGELVDVE